MLFRGQIRALIGDHDASDRLVDTRIRRLRAKLASGGGARLIRTVNGRGYLLDSPVQRIPGAPRRTVLSLVKPATA